MRSNKPPTTAARIAIMTNEKFKIFAADLDVEATRRQIPGIDIVNSTKPATTTTPLVLGSAGSQPPSGHNSLNRSNTNGTLSSSATRAATVGATTDQHHSTSTTTPPPSPTRGSTPLTLLLDTSTAGAAGLQTLPTRLLPILASDATGPTSHSSVASSSAATVNGGGGGSTGSMSKPASVQSLKDPTSAGVVVVLMTAEDFTVARDRMATLGDEEVRVLVRDVRAELEVREEALALAGARQRRRLGGFSGGDEGEGGVDVFSIEEGDEAVGASEGADTRPAAAAGTGGSGNGRFGSLGRLGRGAVAGAAVGTGTGNRGEPSPMRGAPGVTQRRLIPAAPTGSTGAAGPAPSPIAVERQTLLKTITNVDLARLWEDILNEVEKRETAGVSILGDVVASPVAACLPAATALAAEGEAAVARGSVESSVESKSKRRVPRGGEDKDLGKEEAGKKEIGNAAVWRTRISKLSDDQLAEVLADVYDESTRRKEKQEPFLPPRENLSPKRNDARKELAKLPSKELKVLWTIIYENMTNRNML
ncbi:hypothetical protein BC830DRAFT_565160 [Chytriomyces sp. MP71]|nr:hypothetical protein BC830DRAFT_565160 [Chytriomyces sp. MP71]